MQDLWALIVFLTTGLVTALTSEALHEAFFRLAAANARLTASECEKEVLLHDLTHRFKNDLANLTALLRLRARTVADPSANRADGSFRAGPRHGAGASASDAGRGRLPWWTSGLSLAICARIFASP